MGRAEDIVRARENETRRSQSLTTQSQIATLDQEIQRLAGLIKKELDRLDWPDAYIESVCLNGSYKSIAVFCVTSGRCVVGSDGIAYYSTELTWGNDITGYEWAYPLRNRDSANLMRLESLLPDLKSTLERLRGR